MASIENITHFIDIDTNANEVISKYQDMGGKIDQSMSGINKAVDGTGKVTNELANTTEKVSSKATNALSKISDSAKELGDSVKNAITSFAALATGGAVAGFSWLGAEKLKLYSEEVDKAIDSNKKLHVSSGQFNDFISKMQKEAPGWTTQEKASEDIYSTLSMGDEYVGRGQKGLANSEAISKFVFANQEMLNKGGISSVSDLIEQATRTTGKMQGRFANVFQKGTGLTDAEMATSQTRMNALMKKGYKVDIGAELDKRPWVAALNNIEELKISIGDSIAGPLRIVTRGFGDLVNTVRKIPGASSLMGWAAIFITAAGGAGLLYSILKPTVGIVRDISTLSKEGGLLARLFGSSGSMAMLTNPLTILIAIGAILLVVAYKTGMLQKAWDQFNKSSIGKDILSGIKDIGSWIDSLISKFDKWYEATGKNQMLSDFYELCDVLGNAWDYLDKIYSYFKKESGSPIKAGFLTMLAVPAALMAGGMKALTGKGPEDLLEGISTYIQNLTRIEQSWLGKIHDVLNKAKSLWDWVYSLMQNLFSWIQKAIPGAQKTIYGRNINTMLGITDKNPLGIYGITYENGTFIRHVKDAEGQPGTQIVSDQEMVNLYGRRGQRLTLEAVKERSSPDFASGIASAVAAGLGGLGDVIKQSLTDIIPQSLIDSLDRLSKALDNFKWPGEATLAVGTGGSSEPNAEPKGVQGFSMSSEMSGGSTDTGFASGVTFTRSGRFSGKVHASEELVDQAASVKGPGVLAKSIDALDAILNGKPSAIGYGRSVGGEVHIHQQNDFDFSGAKLYPGMDMEAFFSKIDARVKKTAVAAVKDEIGKRR